MRPTAHARRQPAAALTVVIPAYGPAPHLERVVAALKAQTRPVAGIIISHSGRYDPTARFENAPDVTILHSQDRLFAGAARNRGLERVRTAWVAFLDEDMIADPLWHAEMAATIAAGKARCIVGAIGYAETGGFWGLSQWIIEFSALHPHMPARYVHGGASANMAVDVSAFRAIGGFPETWRMSEDTMGHALLRAEGHHVWFAPGPVARHINLRGMRRMLCHNIVLGRHSARLRRAHPNLPGASAAQRPVLSLGLWLARLLLVYGRALQHGGPTTQFLMHLPGIIAGLIAHNIGFCRELFRSSRSAVEPHDPAAEIVNDA